MKKILLIILLCLGSTTAFSQDNNACLTFHTGEFLYKDADNITWELKRTRHRQVEKDKQKGTIIKFKIIWLSDCEYRLTQIWSNDPKRRKWNRAHYSYRIVETTPNSYNYSCVCKGSPSITGTVVRVTN